MKKSRKGLNAVLGLSALAVILVGGAFAYLTDTEATKNVFQVGNVIVDLVEMNKPADDNVFVPNAEVPKAPCIVNSGNVDAIVFMEVTVPTIGPNNDYLLTNEDGISAGDPVPGTPLFTAMYDGSSIESSFSNLTHNNWILIDELEAADATTYIYGYTSILGEGTKTLPLFDCVKVANIVRNVNDESELMLEFKMPVRAWAIQASYVGGYNGELLDAKNLANIFTVLSNQEASNAQNGYPDANVHGRLDLKGIVR